MKTFKEFLNESALSEMHIEERGEKNILDITVGNIFKHSSTFSSKLKYEFSGKANVEPQLNITTNDNTPIIKFLISTSRGNGVVNILIGSKIKETKKKSELFDEILCPIYNAILNGYAKHNPKFAVGYVDSFKNTDGYENMKKANIEWLDIDDFTYKHVFGEDQKTTSSAPYSEMEKAKPSDASSSSKSENKPTLKGLEKRVDKLETKIEKIEK